MTSLIACLGDKPGAIAHVKEIIKQESWDKILIITDKKPKDFPSNVEYIIIDPTKFLKDLAEELKEKIKINDIEVALNVVSGSGKMHMATMSALLKLGLGIRLVALTKQGVQEI